MVQQYINTYLYVDLFLDIIIVQYCSPDIVVYVIV